MDEQAPAIPAANPRRELVDPDRLALEIAHSLQMTRTATQRANLAREAFCLVAETIVEQFRLRGYEITAPNTDRTGPGPQPVFRMPPNVRRED